MNFATATHIGYVREENQDCVEIRTFPDGVLALVCDGMGGERSGKEASTRATEIFLECMEERCQEPMQTYEIRNAMMAAVSAANSVIYTAAKLNYQNFGMGTTCVAAFWNQEGVTIVNVGDSRAYTMQMAFCSRLPLTIHWSIFCCFPEKSKKRNWKPIP